MNKIEFGDCREIMKRWKDAGVKIQTCVTSPPYYGLRDYGVEGQIGLEQTPKEYIENMVDVFNHVKELLADDGTLWVNIGDSYARTGGDSSQKGRHWDGRKNNPNTGHNRYASDMGLKAKDLIGIPWMLAFALREAGWYLRQDIIWHKPNPMPESVTDRCTKSHEYIFLLSKSPQYYFDHVAIKEPSVNPESYKGRRKRSSMTEQSEIIMDKFGATRSGFKNIEEGKTYPTRNKRDVWTVNVRPYKGAHFATYPTALIEPCILAGSPEKICVKCNTPYKRQTKIERNLTLEEVEQIRNNIIETNKEKKPYAIIDKEFRNQVIEYRNLPNHDELREYLQSNRNLIGLTIDEIETAFGTQAPHHWFEKGGSYPDKEDWIKLKQMLLLDDKYDKQMTEIFYKSGLKCDNNYLDEGLVKQCKCDTNETKSGIVFDPFMGSGTTAQVAKQLGRQYLGCELNKEYEKLQQERINNG
jgi:DNA modification methylase